MLENALSKNKFAERKKRGTFIYYLENENEIVGFYELENSGGLASLYVKPNHHKKRTALGYLP